MVWMTICRPQALLAPMMEMSMPRLDGLECNVGWVKDRFWGWVRQNYGGFWTDSPGWVIYRAPSVLFA